MAATASPCRGLHWAWASSCASCERPMRSSTRWSDWPAPTRSELKEDPDLDASTQHLTALVLWGGFALAFAFGVVAQSTNFCTMGAVSDIVNMGHWGRMRMWLLAVAVAVTGTAALSWLGWVDMSATVYQRPTLAWASLIAGGALFGVGMTLAGGCANKNLLRV